MGDCNQESWENLLGILSSLITFKTRADGKGWRDAFENMPIYLQVRPSPAERKAVCTSVVLMKSDQSILQQV